MIIKKKTTTLYHYYAVIIYLWVNLIRDKLLWHSIDIWEQLKTVRISTPWRHLMRARARNAWISERPNRPRIYHLPSFGIRFTARGTGIHWY
jgi:hypothetical protein